MSHFPISKSFLERNAIARRIEEEYGLKNVSCQLITTTLRDVYLVTSARGRNILYIYQHGDQTMEQISAEWQFVEYLHANGVPVAPAVRSKCGELVLAFYAPEGTRFAVLTRFADGVILRQRSTPAAVRAYGEIVATIHKLSDQMPFVLDRAPLDYERMIRESVTAFEREALDRSDELAFLRGAAELLSSELRELSKQNSSYGVIHGDVIRANALVTKDDRVTILDFAFCGYGWRTYDLASYLLTIRGTPEEAKFERAFLDGYNEIRPVTPRERETLPLFEAVRAIFSIGVPADNVKHWGSQYFYAHVDSNLTALKNLVREMN